MTQSSVRPYVWMMAGALAFATMSTLAHQLGEKCDWQVIAIGRTFLAMTFAAGLATAAGSRLVFLRPRVLWMRSLAGSCALIGGFYSITHMDVGVALTLTNMFPVWVAILSWPMVGIKPTAGVWLAVLCAVIGVAFIRQVPASTTTAHYHASSYVWLIALSSSGFSAIALLGLHQLHHVDPRAVVAHFSGVSLLFSIAALFVFPRQANHELVFDQMTLLMLLGVGIFGTTGQIFLTKAFATGHPAKVSVVGLTQVVFGLMYDVILFGTAYNIMTLLGIALIVAPSAWLLLMREK